MQSANVLLVALLATQASTVSAEDANPLGKVIELMDSLSSKVTADGIAEEKAFHAYTEWCDDTTKTQQNDIASSKTKKSELEATIEKATSDIEASSGKVDDLAGKIATAEGELKDATLIRDKEASEFASAEGELMETIDQLERAIGIISKEMAKNPAAFMQLDTSSIQGLVNGLSTIVDAAGFNNADKQRLVAFVQAQQGTDDEDAGAPDPAAYKSHSTGILEVLENLKTKAEDQLADLRKAESNAKHNYALLKQSLEDQMAFDTKEMNEEKEFKAETEAAKATASEELVATTKLLKDTEAALAEVQEDCMRTASDHDASVAGRTLELKVLGEAKQILVETSSGAVEQTYSFVQEASRVGSKLQTRADLQNAEVVQFVRRLARAQHSEALAQLASRIAAIVQFGSASREDPFVKVKGLIKDMISKLEDEADAAAKEKDYCDEQMAKTEAKKSELEDDVAKLTAKIDKKAAESAQLKEEVKTLQGELAALAKQQAEMDQIRADQNAAYVKAKADLELGLVGVRKALLLLRKHYQGAGAAMIQSAEEQPAKPVFHSKAAGAGGSIIDILQVVESDFAKNLADVETEESDAAAFYEKTTQDNKQSTALKSQDVKYKVQEFKSRDKEVDELSADRASTDSELDSVLEYYGKVKERCIAKPETYEERKARREAEIKGLKEALAILSEETAPGLLQGRKRSALHTSALSP